MIVATGRMWIGVAMNGGWALILVLTTIALLGFGAAGLAGARLLSYAVHAIWVVAFAHLYVRKKWLWAPPISVPAEKRTEDGGA